MAQSVTASSDPETRPRKSLGQSSREQGSALYARGTTADKLEAEGIIQGIGHDRSKHEMKPTRRQFLHRSAALPASWMGFEAALAATRTARASAGGRPEETLWPLVRRQFPLEEGLIYLNAANVCPASRPVLDRYAALLRDFQANPSFQNRDKYHPLRESARAKVAALLGVSADEVAFTRNTSEGSNLVVWGIDLKPGDEILITEHNHPSNKASWSCVPGARPWWSRACRCPCRRGRPRTCSPASSRPSHHAPE
jgi:hypothetical protein